MPIPPIHPTRPHAAPRVFFFCITTVSIFLHLLIKSISHKHTIINGYPLTALSNLDFSRYNSFVDGIFRFPLIPYEVRIISKSSLYAVKR